MELELIRGVLTAVLPQPVMERLSKVLSLI